MTPGTEIANIPLNPAAAKTVEDGSSEAGKAFASMREYVSHVKGYLRSYWGCTVEEPRRIIWTIDWENLALHRSFIDSPSYRDFLDLGKPLFDANNQPFLTHVEYQPFPPSKPLEAPATEVAMFTVERSVDKTAIQAATKHLMEVLSSDIPTKSIAYSIGWVVEDIQHPKADGGKGLGYACLVGWESVDAHMKARDTEEFTKAILPIRKLALPPLEGKSMLHVHFRKS